MYVISQYTSKTAHIINVGCFRLQIDVLQLHFVAILLKLRAQSLHHLHVSGVLVVRRDAARFGPHGRQLGGRQRGRRFAETGGDLVLRTRFGAAAAGLLLLLLEKAPLLVLQATDHRHQVVGFGAPLLLDRFQFLRNQTTILIILIEFVLLTISD